MELEHEKFQGAKELAEISTQIAAGTAALASLKQNEEEYMQEREKKLNSRLEKALVDSSFLIKSIGDNHDALVGYRKELVDFHSTILSLLQGITECREALDEAANQLETKVKTHEETVTSFKEATQRERAQIAGEKTALSANVRALADDRRLFEDRRAMLERTIERIKNTK